MANRHINTESDSELLLNAFAEALAQVMPKNGGALTADLLLKAVRLVFKMTRGGYSVVMLISGVGIVAFRDIHGIRPLVIGSRPSATEAGLMDYCAASESVAMDTLGFQLNRDLEPGEAVFFDSRDNSKTNCQCYYRQGQTINLSPCIFEYVYFARPDSIMDGVSVYESRIVMGKFLAKRVQRQCSDWACIDVVIPIPDTSRTSAIEVATTLDRPFREGFQKNRYIARTFIMPGQDARKKTVRLKLNPIKREFRGKNVLLVDDSIVRGTTCIEIIQLAREAGAKKVFFASAAPAVKYPNVYGINLPTLQELVAHDRTDAEVGKVVGADELIYQDLGDLIGSVKSLKPGHFRNGFDASVFDGKYVTGDVDNEYKLGKVGSMQSMDKISPQSNSPHSPGAKFQFKVDTLLPVDIRTCSFASPNPASQTPDTRQYATMQR
jgi:amidophosphoribosyltransferase